MIRFLRNLFVRDWPLKCFSLALAILAWLAISFSLREQVVSVPGATTLSARKYFDLPVTIVSSTGDTRDFKAIPSEVDVTVQGDEATLEKLAGKNIHVMVDVSGAVIRSAQEMPVEITTPPGVTHVRIEPSNLVSIIPPPPAQPKNETE